MHVRLRKFIGTLIFVAVSTVYFLIAISVAIARLPGTSVGVQLLFYAGATVIWFGFSAVLIAWMQKPSSPHP